MVKDRLLTINNPTALDIGANISPRKVLRVTGLPTSNLLIAAVATPIGPDLRPNARLLAERCRTLMAEGCDGITLFGTTGEGAEFAVADRQRTLESLLAAGIAPSRLIVSVGALALPDVAALAAHATALGVAGVLLMPPCLFRSGIGEDGIFRYYAAVIDRVGRDDLRLHLYHFPEISRHRHHAAPSSTAWASATRAPSPASRTAAATSASPKTCCAASRIYGSSRAARFTYPLSSRAAAAAPSAASPT